MVGFLSKDSVKLKLGIFIHEKPFLRSWLYSGVVSSLSQDFEVTIFHDKERVIVSMEEIPYNVKSVGLDFHRSEFKGNLLNDVLLFEFQDKSPTFSYRRELYLLGWYLWKFNSQTIERLVSGLKKIKLLKLFIYKSARYLLLFKSIRRFILPRLDEWLESHETIKETGLIENLDLIILPSNGAENFINPFLGQLNRLNLKSLVALDNWDNMSSKTILRSKPTFITAMGEQSARHAYQVQDIEKENIWVTGLSRFEVYRKYLGNKNLTSKSNLNLRKRVIYLGCAIPHNEVTLLSKLIKSNLYDGVEFIYRPHPQAVPRLGENKIDLQKLGVKLDSSSGPINPRTGWPETTDSFVNLIRNADLVIATPTTLALEAILLGGNVIIDGTIDGVNRTSAGCAINRYLHLRDLRNVNNLRIAKTFDEIINLSLQSLNGEDTNSFEVDISELLFFSEISYAEILRNYIENNLAGK
jgi:hypothetical protein